MRWRRPPTPPGRLPPPPGGRDPLPLDHRDGGAGARRRRSLATATTLMPMIDIGTLFIGREDRGGSDGSGIAKEDDDDTNAEAGGYACDFLEVVLRRLWEGRFGRRRTTTKTSETSRDNEHGEVTRSMFEALCEVEPPPSSLSTAHPKCRSSAMTAVRAGGADPLRTKQSRTGQRQRRRRNGGCFGDDNNYERLPYIQRRDDTHNSIIFIKKHIMCLRFCN
jgi:hypothetical protein